MKEYEERLAHSGGTQTTSAINTLPSANVSNASTQAFPHSNASTLRTSLSTQTSGAGVMAPPHPRTSSRDTSQLGGAGGAEADSSSAMDNGSEGSLSDIGVGSLKSGNVAY